MAKLNELQKAMKKTSDYKTMESLVSSHAIDSQNITEEVTRLHKSRKSSTLGFKIKKNQISGRKLVAAGLEDSAYRSRIVQLKTDVMKSRNYLDIAHKSILRTLQSSFSTRLNSAYKTKDERLSIIKSMPVISRAEEITQELDNLIKVMDVVIEDIDKMAWVIKKSIDAIEIISKGVDFV